MISYNPHNTSAGETNSPYLCHVTAENGKVKDAEDRSVLDIIKRISEKSGAKISARGRNADRKSVSQQTGLNHDKLRNSIPLKHSTEFALYLRGGSPELLKKLRMIIQATIE